MAAISATNFNVLTTQFISVLLWILEEQQLLPYTYIWFLWPRRSLEKYDEYSYNINKYSTIFS
jgi:hypothetical protein